MISKKYFYILFVNVLLLAGALSFVAPSVVHAGFGKHETIDGMAGGLVSTTSRVNGQMQVVVSGTLNAAGSQAWIDSNRSNPMLVYYTRLSSPSDATNFAGDRGQYTAQCSFTSSASPQRGSDGKALGGDAFTCTMTDGLTYGTYIYDVSVFGLATNVVVSGTQVVTIADVPFGDGIDASVLITPSGNSVTVTGNLNAPAAADAKLEDSEFTITYGPVSVITVNTTSLGGAQVLVSDVSTVEPVTIGSDGASFKGTFTPPAPGTYALAIVYVDRSGRQLASSYKPFTFQSTALTGSGGTPNPTGCVTNSDNSNYCMLAPLPGLGDSTGSLAVKSFGDYILIIIKIVFGLIGVLAVFMIVFGGIEYMTGVSAGEKEGGKSRITNAVFGLLLALTSYVILNTLNPRLVTLGVTIPQVAVDGTGLTQTAGDDGLDATKVGNKVKNSAGAELTACDSSNLVTVAVSDLDQGTGIFTTSGSFQINKDVKADLVAAFTDYEKAVASNPSLASYKINTIYGYTCKAATGDKTVYSGHAFGLAIDINPGTNPFTKGAIVTDLPTELKAALTAHGFGWGGNWSSSKDAMHFSKLTNEQGSGADSYSYE